MNAFSTFLDFTPVEHPKVALKVFRDDIVAFIVPAGRLDQRMLTGTGWTICTLTPKGDQDYLTTDED